MERTIVNGIYFHIVGAHLGWKMLWKGGAGRLGQFVFLFTSMRAFTFSPISEFTGSFIIAKCEPMKKYKGACKKSTSKPVKKNGVGRYCDMVVSPSRSRLLWGELLDHIYLFLSRYLDKPGYGWWNHEEILLFYNRKIFWRSKWFLC